MFRLICGLTLGAVALLGQTPAAGPTFDVATIKAAGPLQAQVAAGKLRVGMNIDAARLDIGFMSLAELIPIAFAVKPYQVSGPDWMKQNRFDILAKMPEGATKEQVPQMLQALLAERFKLEAHRESKDHPIYALVVGKNGPKLKDSAPDADQPPPEESAPSKTGGPVINMPEGQVRIGPKGAVVSGGALGTVRIMMGPNGTMQMHSPKMSMQAFADLLTRFMDRPVMDMTELKGTYEIGLDLSMNDLINVARSTGLVPAGAIGRADGPAGAVAAASEPTGGGSIFDAVQQLGLKLEQRKAPVDTIVIDHVEKMPTDN